VAQRRAAAAADLAALAGAVAVQHGQDACPAAVRMARLDRASLRSCRVVGEQVRVVGSVSVVLVGHRVVVQARAHAGPRDRQEPVG
jgi:secretion/DNA translocation related TadE-like protein